MKSLVEATAQEVLSAFWSKRGPVDPLEILNAEGVLLAPGNYGKAFCGRIEYHPDIKKFIVFYPEYNGLITPRTRFSLAHELGHYYLPHHNEVLQQGGSHNSLAGFVCDNNLEREADEFASLLLMPDDYLFGRMKNRSFLTLSGILEMAADMQASATAAAVRYCKFTEEACAVILSSGSEIKFYLPSKKAVLMGFGSRRNLHLPTNGWSTTSDDHRGETRIPGREWPALSWFPGINSRKCLIWEESFVLGQTTQILTLLAFEEQ